MHHMLSFFISANRISSAKIQNIRYLLRTINYFTRTSLLFVSPAYLVLIGIPEKFPQKLYHEDIGLFDIT